MKSTISIKSVYVWLGLNAAGDYEIKSVKTPFGAAPAMFEDLNRARHPFILGQMQAAADTASWPAHLVRFDYGEILDTRAPTPQG